MNSARQARLMAGLCSTYHCFDVARLLQAVLVGALLALAACTVPERLPAVPRSATEQVTVLGGLQNARFWADTQYAELGVEAERAFVRERQELGLSAKDPLPRVDFLAISGGSDDGAFGAGLLVGWTA